MAVSSTTMDKIVALCRRRGFIFGSSEIYGGIGGFWDYGPLGTELKRNVKDAWWLDMVRNHPPGPDGREYDMVGLDSAIIMNPKVWEASGHVGGFSDPLVDCRECRARFRADKVFALVVGDEATFQMLFDLLEWCRKYPEQPAPKELKPRFIASVEADSRPEAASICAEAISRAARAQNAEEWKKCEFLETFSAPGAIEPNSSAKVIGKSGAPYVVLPCQANQTTPFGPSPCPKCGAAGALTEPRQFSLMFKTFVGALEDSTSAAYLRPETAQGIFANFKNVLDTSRVKLPLGIAQIGKSFRNEINPRNYTFRSREFEQYEIEFFCHRDEAEMWYEYWRDLRYQWYVGLGLRSDKLRLREHEADELAHYAKSCADVEYDFPFGISELEGIANRTDFDLEAHMTHSKKDLKYFDAERNERYTPYVIEPSGGVDRSVLAFIAEAYHYDESRASKEFMKFHPRLAPVKAAVFPLVAKDGLPEIAGLIYDEVRKHYPAQYDAKQSIGKRYARMDEAGTPFCFTIDGQTKEDGTVTVRDRDDASQIRIDKSRCLEYLQDQLHI